MRYVRVPDEVSTSEVLDEQFCFSPVRFVRFIAPRHASASHFAPLDKLVIIRDEAQKVDRGATYRYAEIGDINVVTGGVQFRELRGYQLPTDRPAIAQNHDVLISTVRTY